MNLPTLSLVTGATCSALATWWLAVRAPEPVAPQESAAEAEAHFVGEVLPILEARCFKCHGPEKQRVRGGFRMNGRASLVHGGDEGPALDLADLGASALLERVRGADPDYAMPPDDPLPEEELRVLEEWVLAGAPWPGSDDPPPREGGIDYDAARAQWPFTPLVRPSVPEVQGADHPIDAFLARRLDEAGLRSAPTASDRDLVRRLYFDLTGLPPTYEQVEAYVASRDPDKWSRLVDALLGTRAYAERQGRRWLDVMRYAESDGYEHDEAKPYAWRYRDYVIDAFRTDKPYDVFLREQLAGDELEPTSEAARTATGWVHLGHFEKEPNDPLRAEHDFYDDLTRVVSEGFLGLTVGCARCHDHRFDAISQEDYYGLVGFVRNVRPYAIPEFSETSATLTPLRLDDALREQWDRDRRQHVKVLEAQRGAVFAEQRQHLLAELVAEAPLEVQMAFETAPTNRTPEQQAAVQAVEARLPDAKGLRASLHGYRRMRIDQLGGSIAVARKALSFEGNLAWALCAKERDGAPLPTHFFKQGDTDRPGHEVEPRFLPLLVRDDDDARPAIPLTADATTSVGRRTALAEWIASPENPLTARVMVNRIWLGHFGRGIVSTPNDFGAGGTGATHPDLLDWLASEFIESGWSVQHMHRLILSSEAYRRASTGTGDDASLQDPSNRLFWRQNLRRLQAEELRDALFAVSGSLTDSDGGPSFFPRLSREALAGASKPGNGWGLSSEEERRRRAIYAFVKRGMPIPFFQAFDGPTGDFQTGTRQSTTTAMQALTLWNGEVANEAARELSRATARRAGGSADAARRVVALYELALSRKPTSSELDLCLAYLADKAAQLEGGAANLVFEPLVPPRLQDGYIELLPPEDFLYGPSSWTYVKGRWGNWYNNTRERDADRGPAALSHTSIYDGRVSMKMLLRKGTWNASLFFRALPRLRCLSGIELRVDPVAREVVLYEHPGMWQRPVVELARAPLDVTTDTWHDLTVRLSGATLTVDWDGDRVLAFDGLRKMPYGTVGRLGAACRGTGFELADLEVETAAGVERLTGDPLPPATERAFDSLCLSILNLNEFLYVD